MPNSIQKSWSEVIIKQSTSQDIKQQFLMPKKTKPYLYIYLIWKDVNLLKQSFSDKNQTNKLNENHCLYSKHRKEHHIFP